MSDTLIAIQITKTRISISYLNEQGQYVPVPDFDDTSKYHFPNDIYQSNEMVSVGNKSTEIRTAKKLSQYKSFDWFEFISDESQRESQANLLLAIMLKAYHDASIFLHQHSLQCALLHPIELSAIDRESVKALAIKAGFQGCHLRLQSKLLNANNQLNSDEVNVHFHDYGISVISSDSDGFSHKENLNTKPSSLSERIFNDQKRLFTESLARQNLTSEGTAQLKVISEDIAVSLLNGEQEIEINKLIDGALFHCRMNFIHASRYLMPLFSEVAANISSLHEINASTRMSFLSEYRLPDYLKNHFINSVNCQVSFKQLQSNWLVTPLAHVTDNADIRLDTDGQFQLSVIGFDPATKTTKHVALYDSSILPSGVDKKYQLKTNDFGECKIPLQLKYLTNSKSIKGAISINLPNSKNTTVSISLSAFYENEQIVIKVSTDSTNEQINNYSWTHESVYPDMKVLELF